MSGSADDRIWWAPPEVRGMVVRGFQLGIWLLHRCPTAVVVTTQTREQLDPMALGTCRYCGERLPMPPNKETDPSSAIS